VILAKSGLQIFPCLGHRVSLAQLAHAALKVKALLGHQAQKEFKENQAQLAPKETREILALSALLGHKETEGQLGLLALAAHKASRVNLAQCQSLSARG